MNRETVQRNASGVASLCRANGWGSTPWYGWATMIAILLVGMAGMAWLGFWLFGTAKNVLDI